MELLRLAKKATCISSQDSAALRCCSTLIYTRCHSEFSRQRNVPLEDSVSTRRFRNENQKSEQGAEFDQGDEAKDVLGVEHIEPWKEMLDKIAPQFSKSLPTLRILGC